MNLIVCCENEHIASYLVKNGIKPNVFCFNREQLDKRLRYLKPNTEILIIVSSLTDWSAIQAEDIISSVQNKQHLCYELALKEAVKSTVSQRNLDEATLHKIEVALSNENFESYISAEILEAAKSIIDTSQLIKFEVLTNIALKLTCDYTLYSGDLISGTEIRRQYTVAGYTDLKPNPKAKVKPKKAIAKYIGYIAERCDFESIQRAFNYVPKDAYDIKAMRKNIFQ